MHKSFALNLYNDIDIDGHKNIRLLSDKYEATQALYLQIAVRAGEWFLNNEYGLRYFTFLGEKWDRVKEATRAEFTRCLLNMERVEEVISLDFTFPDPDGDSRSLRVDFAVRMDGRIVSDSVEVEL